MLTTALENQVLFALIVVTIKRSFLMVHKEGPIGYKPLPQDPVLSGALDDLHKYQNRMLFPWALKATLRTGGMIALDLTIVHRPSRKAQYFRVPYEEVESCAYAILWTKHVFQTLSKSKEFETLTRYPITDSFVKAIGAAEPEETFVRGVGYLKEAYESIPKSTIEYKPQLPPVSPDYLRKAITRYIPENKKGASKPVKIKKVVFNEPATIVWWDDGEKTVVRVRNGEKYDAEKGLAMAISKKFLGGRRGLVDAFNTAGLIEPRYTWKDITRQELPKLALGMFLREVQNNIRSFGYISVMRLVDLADEWHIFNEPVTLPRRSDVFVLGWKNESDFGIAVDHGKTHIYIRHSPQPIKRVEQEPDDAQA